MLRLFARSKARSQESAAGQPQRDPAPAPADQFAAVSADQDSAAQAGAIRETINLLESDLGVMIREVQHACDLVCREAEDSATATKTITRKTEGLIQQAIDANRDISQLAEAIEGLARSSDQIGQQVRKADNLTGNANESAGLAGATLEGLKKSSAEINHVVRLISKVTRQTNLLALNATIEAARAGEAGRGFAVVANEVKTLAQEAQKATQDIAQKIDALQNDAAACFAAVQKIADTIKVIRPLFGSVAAAVEQQNSATSSVAHNANETLQFTGAVSTTASEIGNAVSQADAHGKAVEQYGRHVTTLAEKLKMRMTIFLRQSEAGDRRRHDRLPCEIGVELDAGGITLRGQTGDLSEGGMLMRCADAQAIAPNTRLGARIDGIGAVRVSLANISALGLHLEFVEMGAAARTSLESKLTSIREESREFISRAVDVGNAISRRFEGLVGENRLTQEDLFDNNYVAIEGTGPTQYRTRFLTALEDILPPIQEPLLEADPRMVFCAAVDRNGYLPVHNRKYALPQRPGETAWNMANSRTRRIFDDRAGLAAARNVRPYIIQVYPRDMGNGVTVVMREIDAPIRVFGKHWGGFRTAYKL
jgi:methyl-accepting chemotaxis protein